MPFNRFLLSLPLSFLLLNSFFFSLPRFPSERGRWWTVRWTCKRTHESDYELYGIRIIEGREGSKSISRWPNDSTRLDSIRFDSIRTWERERRKENAMNNGRWEWYLFFLFPFFSPRSILRYIENMEEEEFSIIDCWKKIGGGEGGKDRRSAYTVCVIDYWPSRVSPCGKREYGDSVWSMCIYRRVFEWVHVSRKGISSYILTTGY